MNREKTQQMLLNYISLRKYTDHETEMVLISLPPACVLIKNVGATDVFTVDGLKQLILFFI